MLPYHPMRFLSYVDHRGWKLALQQELRVEELEPTLLVYFRPRFMESAQSKLLLDSILQTDQGRTAYRRPVYRQVQGVCGGNVVALNRFPKKRAHPANGHPELLARIVGVGRREYIAYDMLRMVGIG